MWPAPIKYFVKPPTTVVTWSPRNPMCLLYRGKVAEETPHDYKNLITVTTMKGLKLCIYSFLMANITFAQTLTGPTGVRVGDIRDYAFTSDYGFVPTWTVNKGRVISKRMGGSSRVIATIEWLQAGAGSVNVQYGNLTASLNVTIGAGGGSGPCSFVIIPKTPSVTFSCGQAVLTAHEDDINNPFVEFYWQTIRGGESTDHQNSITVTSGGTYYLRGLYEVPGLSCWGSDYTYSLSGGIAQSVPPAPVSNGDVSRFDPGYVKLRVSPAATATGYKWYFDPVGSPSEAVTGTTLLKYFDQSQTYYVAAENICGEGSRTPVSALINERSETANDREFNWIITYGYDVGDVIVAASKNYFDLLGEGIQQQTKVLSGNAASPSGNILVKATLNDRFDRPTLTTLPVPSQRQDFLFHENFIQNQGNDYDYTHFDLDNNRLSPDLIDQDTPYTLGWYYSTNNTLEDNVPVTTYPYSRIEYYDDGTGEIKRSAAPGESHRLGSTHEVYTRTFEVSTELDHYLTVRNKLFGIVNGPTTMAGEAIQSVIIDENNNLAVSFADRNENVLMTAKGGNWTLPGTRRFTLENGEGSFYLLDTDNGVSANSNLSITSVRRNIEVYNGDGASIPSLEAGFYQVDNGAANLAITPSYGFGDISYNFYDDAGRLIASIAPNGVKQILDNPTLLNDIINLPFTTYYTYNHQGWLLSTREPDAGITNYQYRRDGSIRFSRNADQAAKSHFSYTHYDALGRPIESGEYTGTAVTFGAGTKAIVNNEGPETGWADTDQRSWVKTHYDLPDDIPSKTGLNTYTQDFVMGAVSWTENENITTWYSYDEQGRVTWMLQKPKAMPLVFAAEYTYDFLGNVLTTAFKSYVGATVMEQFYHHYEYDADKRLSKASTSLDGVNQTLQARYIYYLHGPLKRIELDQVKQGIDFVYNIQGWLTRINHPDPNQDPGGDGNGRFNPDAFGMILAYYEKELTNSALAANILPQTDPSEFHFDPEEKGNAQWAIVDHFLLRKSLGGFYEHQSRMSDGMSVIPGMSKYGAQKAYYQEIIEKYKQHK